MSALGIVQFSRAQGGINDEKYFSLLHLVFGVRLIYRYPSSGANSKGRKFSTALYRSCAHFLDSAANHYWKFPHKVCGTFGNSRSRVCGYR
jgi:hypothetical protein